MSRYIDIDDISLRKTVAVGGLSAKALWRRIQQAPSIDIVRCGECKHRVVEEQSWGEYNEYCDLWCDGNGYWASVNADDFCSYGEREGE